MPIDCPRPLCSATVFACNTAAALQDTYTRLSLVRTEYSKQELVNTDLEVEASIVTSLYRRVGRRFKCIVVGAASGGAAQLATVLGAPFLPCNVLTPVKRDAWGHPDDADSYLLEALPLSLLAARRLRGAADIIVHYDPIHDRSWVTRDLTIRIHYTRLPEAYKRFIREALEPGGDIVYIDVPHPWIQFRADENLFIQIGGADDLEDWEYIRESKSVKEYIDKLNIARYPWSTDLLDTACLEKMPESEWGSRRGLLESVKAFAEENNYSLHVVRLNSFYKATALGLAAYQAVYGDPRGLVIENYKQSSSTLPLKRRYAPLWAVFTTKRALRELERAIRVLGIGTVDEIIYVTVPYGYREQGVKWPDALSLDEWRRALASYAKRVIVVPESVKPWESTRKLDVMNRIYEEAWRLGAGHPAPSMPSIDVGEVVEFITKTLSRL